MLDARLREHRPVAVEILLIELVRRVHPVLLGADPLDGHEDLLVDWLTLVLATLLLLLPLEERCVEDVGISVPVVSQAILNTEQLVCVVATRAVAEVVALMKRHAELVERQLLRVLTEQVPLHVLYHLLLGANRLLFVGLPRVSLPDARNSLIELADHYVAIDVGHFVAVDVLALRLDRGRLFSVQRLIAQVSLLGARHGLKRDFDGLFHGRLLRLGIKVDG